MKTPNLSAGLALLALSTAPASAQPLSIAEVDAQEFACLLSPTCTLVVDDSSAPIVFQGVPGEGFLQSRTYPVSIDVGFGGSVLWFYEYRIDLRGMEGPLPCFDLFGLDVSVPILTFADLDGNGSSDQVFVKTSGGLGSYGPDFLQLNSVPPFRHIYGFGSIVTSVACAGSSSYFFGFASVFPPVSITASLGSGVLETPIVSVAARGSGAGMLRPDVFVRLIDAIAGLDPDDCVTGATAGARSGRIKAMQNRVAEAETLTAAGLLADASAVLANLRSKLDGVGEDWVRNQTNPCADETREATDALIGLLDEGPVLMPVAGP